MATTGSTYDAYAEELLDSFELDDMGGHTDADRDFEAGLYKQQQYDTRPTKDDNFVQLDRFGEQIELAWGLS